MKTLLRQLMLLKATLFGLVLFTTPPDAHGQVMSLSYKPHYANYVPSFNPSTDQSVDYTYVLDGRGEIHSVSGTGMSLMAYESATESRVKKTGPQPPDLCFGYSVAKRYYTESCKNVFIRLSGDPDEGDMYPSGCTGGTVNYPESYFGSLPTITTTSGLWYDAGVQFFTCSAGPSSVTIYTFSGLPSGLSISGGIKKAGGACSMSCGDSPFIYTQYGFGTAQGAFLVITAHIDASNYATVIPALTSALSGKDFNSGCGGFPGYNACSSAVPALFSEPRWDYSSCAFKADLLNYTAASQSYTVKKSTDNGSTWSTASSVTIPAWSSLLFTDTGACSDTKAIYRLISGTNCCTGNVVGFTKLSPTYTKQTAHGISVVPSDSRVSALFPPAYDWEISKWNGSGYDTASISGGVWDDPTLTLDYLDGFFLLQDTSGAPAPRICGYVPVRTISHSFPTGSRYYFVASGRPTGFSLNSGGPTGSSGANAYQWNVSSQTWTSTSWNTGATPPQWSSNYSYAAGEGMFIYFSGTTGSWDETETFTCP